MGYDTIRFVNLSPEIAENFKCSVCLDIFKDPREFPCGHIFCLECFEKMLIGGSSCECPQCRQRVELRQSKQPNRILQSLLQNLDIKCEFANLGCRFVVKLEKLDAHITLCHFNPIQTPTAPFLDELNYVDPESVQRLLNIDSNSADHLERLLQIQDTVAAAISRLTNPNVTQSGEGNSNESHRLTNDDRIGGRILVQQLRVVLERYRLFCANNASDKCMLIILIVALAVIPLVLMIIFG